MGGMRKPLQGVWNIVRFNWHYYAGAGLSFLFLTGASLFLPQPAAGYTKLLGLAVLVPMVVSLGVSWYVYDFSDLYRLHWLRPGRKGADF